MGNKSKFIAKHGLQVNTTSGSTPSLKFPSADGSFNQFIRTDGSGNLSFDSTSAGGASNFTGLSDTPINYTGEAGKAVIVNPGETGLQFSQEPISNSLNRHAFTGDGTTTDFTTGTNYAGDNYVLVFVDGVIQYPGTNFSLDSTILVFTSAPANNADITVYGTVVAAGFPTGSVTGSALENPLTLTGGLTLTGHLLPAADSTYDLGDSAVKWRDLYMAGSTIHIGGKKIQADTSGIVLPAGSKIGSRSFRGGTDFDSSLVGTYGSASAIPILKLDSTGMIDSIGTAPTTSDLVGDITPQLGGNLDLNGKVVTNSTTPNPGLILNDSGTSFSMRGDSAGTGLAKFKLADGSYRTRVMGDLAAGQWVADNRTIRIPNKDGEMVVKTQTAGTEQINLTGQPGFGQTSASTFFISAHGKGYSGANTGLTQAQIEIFHRDRGIGNQTADMILTAGAGSRSVIELNADSAYLNVDRVTIDGKVGIGTKTAEDKLHAVGSNSRKLIFGDSCLTVATSTATTGIADANVAKFRKTTEPVGLDVIAYKDGTGYSSGIATNINETAGGGVSLQDNTYIGMMYWQDNRTGSKSHNFSSLDTNGSTYRTMLSMKGDSTMEATFGGKVKVPASGIEFSDGTSQTTAASGISSVASDTSPDLGGNLNLLGYAITNSISTATGSGTSYDLRIEKATSDYVGFRMKNTQNFPGGGGSPYSNWPIRLAFEAKNQGQVSREIAIIWPHHANGTNTTAEKGALSFNVHNGYSSALANCAVMVPCDNSNAGGIKTQGLHVGVNPSATTFPSAGNITIASGGYIEFGDGTQQSTAPTGGMTVGKSIALGLAFG